MKTGAIVGIQDMGAAGLTCSTCEMSSRAGTGMDVELGNVPQRESGMTPYEIMLSESQERMLLVAEKGRENEVFEVFRKWGLDAATVGVVTDTGRIIIRDHGRVVADVPGRQLADEAPLYDRPHTKPYRTHPLERPAPIPPSADLTGELATLLASPDLCSKRWIWEQYDYMVRTNTTAGPGAADAAVIRIKETGTSVAMSLDGNGRYCYLDPREGTMLIVAECCRNLSTVGAEPVATTNNLNFGNPERPEIMAQLAESIEGLAEACEFFQVPVTGGNVSLYNETLGTPIFPSPVVGIVGLLPTREPVGIGFRNPGRKVILLGGAGSCDDIRFGGTQYAKAILDELWGLPPALDMDFEKRVQAAIRRIVSEGLAESAHDLSDGGLAVALAESAFPYGIGASTDLDSDLRPEFLLFGEAPSRIVVSTTDPSRIQSIAEEFGVPAPIIGDTIVGRLEVRNRNLPLITSETESLRRLWAGALEKKLESRR
jgi:phosphoribosylformylglycinamidine synthase